MKITNKKLVIILGIIVAGLLIWTWLAQNNYLKNENSNNTVTGEELTLEQEPTIRIISPGNQAIVNPGPLIARYVLSDETDAVKRVELELVKDEKTIIKVSGSFNPVSKSGSQMVSTVDEGDYILRARLVNQTGAYFESGESIYITYFKVKSAYIEE
jgi:hypothetical protein